MITMTDIAKLTGVSQSTVSRVLSGNTSVNPDVKARVLKCARENNYQPNIIARSLSGSKTYLLGVVVTDIANPFFSDIVKSIESEASKQGYSIMLFNTNYDFEKEKQYLKILKRYKVDGILIVPTGKDSDYKELIKTEKVPMVSITRDTKGMDSVFISHYDAGRKVAKHLLNLGYGNFIYYGPKFDDKEKGYKDELKENRIDLDNNYLYIDENSNSNQRLKDYVQKRDNTEGIGIFAQNDVHALVVLQMLKEMNLSIPQEAALVGFDNTFISRITSPSITSIAQPINEIGKLAIERIIELINDKDSAKECLRCQLDTRVITRQSTVRVKRTYINKK